MQRERKKKRGGVRWGGWNYRPQNLGLIPRKSSEQLIKPVFKHLSIKDE